MIMGNLDAVTRVPSIVRKKQTESKRSAIDMSVQGDQKFLAIVALAQQGLQRAASRKRQDITRVFEEVGKEIVNAGSGATKDIAMLVSDAEEAAGTLKYEME